MGQIIHLQLIRVDLPMVYKDFLPIYGVWLQ